MKIALVTRRYPPLIGGAERVLSYLAPALASEGAEVVVLTARSGGLAPSEVVSHGCRVERLATSKARFVGTFLYMRELSRWFARNRVDLAYVSMLKHDAYAVLGEGLRRGFPVVLRPEGAGATGDLAWQSWGRFGRTIGRRCRQADAVVAISSAVRGELIGAGYAPSKVVDLPNGVPIPDRGWEPGTDPTSLRAAYVGRLAPEKGLDALVDAWPIVRAGHPEARLTLVGEGPERPGLEARIARLGLMGSVELAGAVADPSEILRSSDLFVLPSREEGMSIALLEAMVLGIPSVASAIPGNLALMTDREHGRLAPPDDPAALARMILEHRADPDALRMAIAARRRVSEHYSISAVARRHLELFRELIDRSPHSSSP
ncbi:glycosyltransferase family 4 protein [Tundrisphaera lichenicola]|uniref:glycosyltransferase family 4 protein n=1 Tax=Tundrisphaera lichenicola TaxID=2029860 RepID=UPI003EB8ADCC